MELDEGCWVEGVGCAIMLGWMCSSHPFELSPLPLLLCKLEVGFVLYGEEGCGVAFIL